MSFANAGMAAAPAAAGVELEHRGRLYRGFESPAPDYVVRSIEPLAPSAGDVPLTFIHGMEEGWEVWEALMWRLLPSFRVSALDMPWSGRRGFRWAGRTPVARWIEHGLAISEDGPPVVAIAHSFGANALLEYLEARGCARLAAVVVISPFFLAGRQEFDWPLLDHYLENFDRFLERCLQVRTGPGGDLESTSLTAEKLRHLMGPAGWLQFLNIVARLPWLDLRKVTVPFLVVGGRDDFYALPSDGEALGQALPHAEVRLLDDCGHFGMLEQPEQLARLIEGFLRRSLRSGLRQAQED